jgi:hypothetical protein
MTGAGEIVRALGGRNGMARCPAHRDRTPSLAVREVDGRTLVHCHAGCDQGDVIAALRAMGLWPERDEADRDAYRKPRPAPAPKPPAVYWHTGDAPENTQRACEIWRTSVPLWHPDAQPARAYLTGRGLPWPWPETLAFHRIAHPETNEIAPALIVARHCPVVGMVRGIQRIFLTEDGRKYAAGTCKMSLGSIEGGRCELIWKFPVVELVIAEGVESALAAHRLFNRPAWAACGGFPASLPMPSTVRNVVICADHDPHGVSERRGKALARSIRASGRRCSVVMPSVPGRDANDILLRGAA